MGLFSRRKQRGVPQVDGALPDDQWMAQSQQVYESEVSGYYGSPDRMAEGASLHYGHRNFGTSMLLYAKSVDMLQTAYGYAQMAQRQPSVADRPIVDGFVKAIGASVAMHPAANLQECGRQTAALLRGIAGDCVAAGLPGDIYANGADAVDRELERLS